VIQFSTEEKFYQFLGLDYIPPELRENTGEIELAKIHKLPRLIELTEIKGDLHVHTNFDIEPSHDLGTSSVKQLAAAAYKLGYEYIGLTDHNPSVAKHTEKQTIELLKRRSHEIASEKGTIKLFNGLEIDILPDGKRAVSDQALELLDYAICSIHSSFRQSRKVTTDRVLTGLDHPKVKIFGHPSARLLGEREGIDLDWDRVFDFCQTHAKWLEIDAWPNRLDLPDNLVREAVKAGIKLVIDSDSHDAASLPFITYGISVARRGWATAKDIANTLDLQDIMKLIPVRR
jgi:DNA polymerase (family 10)